MVYYLESSVSSRVSQFVDLHIAVLIDLLIVYDHNLGVEEFMQTAWDRVQSSLEKWSDIYPY